MTPGKEHAQEIVLRAEFQTILHEKVPLAAGQTSITAFERQVEAVFVAGRGVRYSERPEARLPVAFGRGYTAHMARPDDPIELSQTGGPS
jgi:hypothetical protein